MNVEKEPSITIDDEMRYLIPPAEKKHKSVWSSEKQENEIIFIDEETLSRDELEEGDRYGAEDK